MSFRSGQKGEGKLGCILWTAALALAILIAWKMIPVKLASVELYDFMIEQAKFAGGERPKVLEERILRKAKELDLPLEKKRLKVERVGDSIRMRAQYTVPVEFPGYTYQWEFNHEVDRPIFYF